MAEIRTRAEQAQHSPQLFTAFLCLPRRVDDGERLGFYDSPIDYPPAPESEALAQARRQCRTTFGAIGYCIKPAMQGGCHA